VIRATQSILARSSLPTCLLAGSLVAFVVVPTATMAAQATPHTVSVETDLVKEPGGVVLVRLAKGAAITPGAVRGTWQEVTLEGWIPLSALRNDSREGFDVAINRSAGVPVRAAAPNGAIRGTARAGALFDRIETRNQWVHVRRKAWVARSAVQAPGATAPARQTPAQPPAAAAAPAPGSDSSGWVTVPGGTTLAAQPSGAQVGALEAALRGEVVERRDGWSKVRLEAWVRDGTLGVGPPPDQITAEEIRTNPERYIGQTVEWTIQVLAVQKADELRPELPLGQPYVLARGPLPETGFVYLLVQAAEAERFRGLEPLAEVRVRATVRSGRTRFLPTPVLTFVRRLD
jgi:hypothetical protein